MTKQVINFNEIAKKCPFASIDQQGKICGCKATGGEGWAGKCDREHCAFIYFLQTFNLISDNIECFKPKERE